MTHFGLICPASTGHLNTMLPLGKELQRRGHRVTLVGLLDDKPKTLAVGLEFRAIGESEFPTGATAEMFAQLGKMSGLVALLHTIRWFQKSTATFLREAPEVLKQAGVEALLVDQVPCYSWLWLSLALLLSRSLQNFGVKLATNSETSLHD